MVWLGTAVEAPGSLSTVFIVFDQRTHSGTGSSAWREWEVPMIVTILTAGELWIGKAVGTHRHTTTKAKGRKGARKIPEGTKEAVAKALYWDILGARGESAGAKVLNQFWYQPDFRDRKRGDIGWGVHVRTTDKPHGCLIVHEDDADDGIFILVIRDIAIPARFQVIGFLYGRDAKDQKWWRTDIRNPAFLVPQSALVPIERLPGLAP